MAGVLVVGRTIGLMNKIERSFKAIDGSEQGEDKIV